MSALRPLVRPLTLLPRVSATWAESSPTADNSIRRLHQLVLYLRDPQQGQGVRVDSKTEKLLPVVIRSSPWHSLSLAIVAERRREEKQSKERERAKREQEEKQVFVPHVSTDVFSLLLAFVAPVSWAASLSVLMSFLV